MTPVPVLITNIRIVLVDGRWYDCHTCADINTDGCWMLGIQKEVEWDETGLVWLYPYKGQATLFTRECDEQGTFPVASWTVTYH